MFGFIVLSHLIQLGHSVSVTSIVVETASGKYDGTDDTLTMTIYGSKRDAERISIGKSFTAGKSKTISIRYTPDIGTPECVVFQTSGEDFWVPKEVTIKTSGGQSFSFLNSRGIGLSNKEKMASGWAAAIGFCTPITESTAGRPRKCTIKTRTSTKKHTGTDNCLMVPRIYGDAGVVVGEKMDRLNYDDFKVGALDTFSYENMQNVGRVRYLQSMSLIQ